jgi:hypothetical protein
MIGNGLLFRLIATPPSSAEEGEAYTAGVCPSHEENYFGLGPERWRPSSARKVSVAVGIGESYGLPKPASFSGFVGQQLAALEIKGETDRDRALGSRRCQIGLEAPMGF